MSFNYSFEIHEFNKALKDNAIRTLPPAQSNQVIDDFREGEHFRTGTEDETNSLILELEDRLLTLILDESGSMTWNDFYGDRYTYAKRLLTKLDQTYPGQININLIGFGGTLTTTTLFVARENVDSLSSDTELFTNLTKEVFGSSVFDFSGVRVVRRSDRFPTTPADGVVVTEGIVEAAKDENLSENQTYYYGIWSFNKQNDFDVGQFVSGFPTDRVLPKGVALAEYEVRVPTGIQRDDNTQIIYNFLEGSGFIIFDSSDNGRHGFASTEIIEENFWSGDATVSSYSSGGRIKQRAGARFDGEFDIIETDVDRNVAYISGEQALTITFWLNRYNDLQEQQQWIVGTSTEEISHNIGWAIGLSATGEILLEFEILNSGFTISTGVTVPQRDWTMVTVILDSGGASVYLDGQNRSSGIVIPELDTSDMTKLYLGAKPEDSASVWPGSDYFGTLSHFSISNTARDADFLSDQFNAESNIFIRSFLEDFTSPIDNTQREVILRWNIGSDFDFEGGSVKILRKYNSVPSHHNDGDVIVEQSANAGEFIFLDTFDFIHNSNYFYRIFTFNSLNIPCDRADARILSVSIPALDSFQGLTRPDSVTDVVVTPGDRKIFLQWSTPSDPNIRGTKIFFKLNNYPTTSIGMVVDGVVSDGIEIADITESFIVHRSRGQTAEGAEIPLLNDTVHYYTIVTYNEFGVFSEPALITGTPSEQFETVFPPAPVTDLHLDIINPQTLSIQWKNPMVKSEQINIFMGEVALLFASIRDLFGGGVNDLLNMTFEFFTNIAERRVSASDVELGFDPIIDESLINEPFTGTFPDAGMTTEAIAETILNFGVVGSGLIKGTITHTSNPQILSRRESYTMIVRATYKVVDPDTQSETFIFNSQPVKIVFDNPFRIAILNRDKREVTPPVEDNAAKGDHLCKCPENQGGPSFTAPVPGAFIGSTAPYVARIEIQFKNTALRDGHPFNITLVKSGTNEPSTRTSIREGAYASRSIEIEEVDDNGITTGRTISKSIVDVEVSAPTEPDRVDLRVLVENDGFLVEGSHTIKFIGSMFINLDATKPIPDGIDVAEQFATVWIVNPDDPIDPTKQLSPPDGTLVKWELIRKRFARERPFYSEETVSQFLSGVYSSTTNGLAKNVFFGPVSALEKHVSDVSCGGEIVEEDCCLAEEYAIKVSVNLGDLSASDEVTLAYICEPDEVFSNKRFLINAAEDWTDNKGNNPEWITWADGIHMLKFEIAQNPIGSSVRGADCFVNCVNAIAEADEAVLFNFTLGHIIEIRADGEILWDVTFDEDPYTGELTLVSFKIISPKIAKDLAIENVARIPIRGTVTDFYIRKNAVIPTDPREMDVEQSTGNVLSSLLNEGLLPNEWIGQCRDVDACSPVRGTKWIQVSPVRGRSTVLANGREVTLVAGGDYEDGVPPVLIGFREPLKARVIEARAGGRRIQLLEDEQGRQILPVEELADGVSFITFVVDATFTGDPVPDGVPVEIETIGNVVQLSNCVGTTQECTVSSSGVVFFKQINDPFLNPNDPDNPGSVPKKSLAFFTINPLSPNTIIAISEQRDGADGRIDVFVEYDKRGDLDALEFSEENNE